MKEVRICCGPTCSALGGRELLEQWQHLLGLQAGEEDPLRNIKLEKAYCFGLCEKGPNFMVGEILYSGYSHQNPIELLDTLSLSLPPHPLTCSFCSSPLGKHFGEIKLVQEKPYHLLPNGKVEVGTGSQCPHCRMPLFSGEFCKVCNTECLSLAYPPLKQEIWICPRCQRWGRV